MKKILMILLPISLFVFSCGDVENGVDGFVIKKFDTHDLSLKSYASLYENPVNWATKKNRANRASKKHSSKLFNYKLDEIIKNYES